jgi:hypothetical protein
MKQVIKSNLLRRVLILSFLLAALVFVMSSGSQPQTAYASQCCSECLPDYNLCMSLCSGNSVCEQNCWNKLNACNHHCVMCDGTWCIDDGDCTALPGGTCDSGQCSY